MYCFGKILCFLFVCESRDTRFVYAKYKAVRKVGCLFESYNRHADSIIITVLFYNGKLTLIL